MSVHVSSWAWKQRVGDPGAKLVLVKLADNANDEGLAFPGQAKIAEECELSARNVRYKIAKLSEGGFLTVTVRSRLDGTRTSNLYQLAIGNGLPVDVQPEAKYVANQRQPVAGHEPSVEPPVLETPNGVSSDFSGNGHRATTADLHRVYDHWRQVRGKTRGNYATISSARRAKINTRLREFSADELCRALDAVALDDWEGRDGHDDLPQLFGSREKVDRWLDKAEGKGVRLDRLTPDQRKELSDRSLQERMAAYDPARGIGV